LLRNQFWD